MVSSSPYKSLHQKIAYHRGKASEYKCVDCGKEAYNWSWIHDTDQLNIKNYEPRCKKCHVKYDDCGAKLGSDNHMSRFNENEILEIRRLYATGKYTQKEIGEKYGAMQGTIGRIIRREQWKHI